MANLSETSTFEAGIYQLELNDPVDAGIGGAGVSNLQAKQLANRTKYLKDHVDAAEADIAAVEADILALENTGVITYGGRKFKDRVVVSANTTLDVANHAGVLLEVDTAGVVITVPAVGLALDGVVFTVINKAGSGTIKVVGSGPGNSLFPGDAILEPGECVEIANKGTNYDITSLFAPTFQVPVGMVMAYAATSPPPGWLACNGAAVSQTTYARLYGVIGSTFAYLGAPGAGNFRVPDLRAEFIRGYDNGRGVDTGRTFGDAQAEATNSNGQTLRVADTNFAGSGSGVGDKIVYFSSTNISAYGTGSTMMGGSETRPRNVNLLYCIKY